MDDKDTKKDDANTSHEEERTDVDNDSDSSLENQDLINSINYNTITSLAALKDVLQGDGTNTVEADSFFKHYFMNHCSNLSSSDSVSPFIYPERRRLSECKEEDEDNEKIKKESDQTSGSKVKKVKSPKAQELKAKADKDDCKEKVEGEYVSDESVDNDESHKRTVVGVRHKFLVTKPKDETAEQIPPLQSLNAHTVHFGTKGAEEIRPNVKTIFDPLNLRRDKKYFDSSLIEIRSKVAELDTPSEDIWIKREEPKPKPIKKVLRVSEEHKKSDTLPKEVRRMSLDDTGRARASSFGSRKDKGFMRKFSQDKKEKKKKSKSKDEVDGLSYSSTQSVTSKPEWWSTDAGSSNMYQLTIHGTSGVSRRPVVNSSKDSKRHPSLIQQVVVAVQNIGKSSEKAEPKKDNKDKDSKVYRPTSKDGSAHPHSSSDAKYYHTMTAAAQRRPSGAIAKVMDVFRSRPSSSNDAADKRKARALLQLSQQNAAGAKIMREAHRRRSLGQIPRQRADSTVDPSRAVIVVRDENGVPTLIPYLDKDSKLSRGEDEAVYSIDLIKEFEAVGRAWKEFLADWLLKEEDEAQIFVKFFKYHTCYDLMPISAKLVIFDTTLRVKKAFYALVDNGVRAAPLWDTERHQFVGMLTITDFIKILQMYYTSPNVAMDELEEHRLGTWRDVLRGSSIPLVWIEPRSSLLDAIRKLISNKIHRLPVIDPDTGDVIHIITHKRILRFLFLYIKDIPKPAYLDRKLRDLQIGTLNNVETATEDTLIIEALTKFVNRRVSALPIVDEEGRLINIYAKFDVINLAARKTYHNLNVTLKKANEHRNAWFKGVHKCALDETLYEIMERIVKAEVHRLVIVDEEDKVIGIISLSDILQYIALKPTEAPIGRALVELHASSIDEAEENQAQSEDSSDTEKTGVPDNQDESGDCDTKTLSPDDNHGNDDDNACGNDGNDVK